MLTVQAIQFSGVKRVGVDGRNGETNRAGDTVSLTSRMAAGPIATLAEHLYNNDSYWQKLCAQAVAVDPTKSITKILAYQLTSSELKAKISSFQDGLKPTFDMKNRVASGEWTFTIPNSKKGASSWRMLSINYGSKVCYGLIDNEKRALLFVFNLYDPLASKVAYLDIPGKPFIMSPMKVDDINTCMAFFHGFLKNRLRERPPCSGNYRTDNGVVCCDIPKRKKRPLI